MQFCLSLAAYGLNSVQVTIDGDKKTHNERRPHKKDPDSYTRIMKNLAYAVGKIKVAVRVNIDRNNYNFDFSSFLRELGYPEGHKNLYVYVAKLTSETTQKFSPLSDRKFSECYLENYQKAIEKGVHKWKPHYFKLEPINLFCAADSTSTLVFLPDGKVTNCWNHLSSPDILRKHTIGKIDNGNLDIYHSVLASWLDKTDLCNLPAKCDNCSLLPICLGGCPVFRENGSTQCCYPKFDLQHYVESILQLNETQRRRNESHHQCQTNGAKLQ
jgi:uncharacterized protein